MINPFLEAKTQAKVIRERQEKEKTKHLELLLSAPFSKGALQHVSPGGDNATLRLNIFEPAVRLFSLCQKQRHQGISPHLCTKDLHPQDLMSLCHVHCSCDTLPRLQGSWEEYLKREVWPTMILEEKGTHLIDT